MAHLTYDPRGWPSPQRRLKTLYNGLQGYRLQEYGKRISPRPMLDIDPGCCSKMTSTLKEKTPETGARGGFGGRQRERWLSVVGDRHTCHNRLVPRRCPAIPRRGGPTSRLEVFVQNCSLVHTSMARPRVMIGVS
jgi:hypothetical protein